MQESGYNMTKMENMQLIFAAKGVHNLESTQKEYSILKKIGVLGKTHVEKRNRNKQSIESGLARINEKDVMLTCKKFETAYFIAKEELPLTKFERILALEELHNSIMLNQVMLIATITYVENLLIIADDLALKVLQKLKSSNFHSALWDGTTDVSVSEKETIFVLYLDKVGSDGEVLVKTEFLGLAEVNHAHVEGIKQSIYESFVQIGMQHFSNASFV